MKETLALAGATGFVGQELRAALANDFRLVGLTRSATRAAHTDPQTEWRRVDLFSRSDVERALEGVDRAIYLVHSMLPSARLTQASFEDLDLLMSDNFARAAEHQGLKQIVYLGGIVPEGAHMSRHLSSRLEVERVLASRRTPLTALRAGLVVGRGGSSLQLLVKLVQRLPMMVLPAWTQNLTQPIAVADVVRAIRHTLSWSAPQSEHFDIGGPDVMTYANMLRRTADLLGKRRLMIPVPFFSPELSKLWVTLFGGAPIELVGPLVESLRYRMVVRDNALQSWLEPEAMPFDEALQLAVNRRQALAPNPRVTIRARDDTTLKEARTVRSVQRLPLPRDRNARWVAGEYMCWLPRFLWPFVRVDVRDDGVCGFFTRWPAIKLLELTRQEERSDGHRQLFFITGGILNDPAPDSRGRFEFREVRGEASVISAVHDFRPSLPWFLYSVSQALMHLWIMRRFRRHLRQLSTPKTRKVGIRSE